MLILGSKSPRRKEILTLAQIPFKVIVSDALEDSNNSDPVEFVKENAYKKAMSITNKNTDDIILCCDTIVYIDNKIS